MIEFTIDFLSAYYSGKDKPIFMAARTKDEKLVYVARNRKAKRLLLSDKFINILKQNNLSTKNGYIQQGE